MGPYGEAYDHVTRGRIKARLKAAITAEFPGWDVHDVFGGFEAVPEGTPVIRSVTLDGLMDKLAEHRDGTPR
jgi:hypothetical protein